LPAATYRSFFHLFQTISSLRARLSLLTPVETLTTQQHNRFACKFKYLKFVVVGAFFSFLTNDFHCEFSSRSILCDREQQLPTQQKPNYTTTFLEPSAPEKHPQLCCHKLPGHAGKYVLCIGDTGQDTHSQKNKCNEKFRVNYYTQYVRPLCKKAQCHRATNQNYNWPVPAMERQGKKNMEKKVTTTEL
jgi:hypothetical protein